jgi:hypothetical protein
MFFKKGNKSDISILSESSNCHEDLMGREGCLQIAMLRSWLAAYLAVQVATAFSNDKIDKSSMRP